MAKKCFFIRTFFVIVSDVELFRSRKRRVSSIDLVQHIQRTDGFLGLYRGFGLSFLSKVVAWYATTTVDEVIRSISPFSRSTFLLQFLEPANARNATDDERPTWNSFVQKVTTKPKIFPPSFRFAVEFKRSAMSIVGNSPFASISR